MIEIADEALHAHQRDVDGRQCGDHAPIAFVGHEANPACFSYTEIYAADAYICCKEDIAQNFACGVGERGNVFGIWNAKFFMEEFPNIVATQMHRGCDDMCWL